MNCFHHSGFGEQFSDYLEAAYDLDTQDSWISDLEIKRIEERSLRISKVNSRVCMIRSVKELFLEACA